MDDYTLISESNRSSDYNLTSRVIDTFMERVGSGHTRISQKPKQVAIDLLKRKLEEKIGTPFTAEFNEADPQDDQANTLMLQDASKRYSIIISSVATKGYTSKSLMIDSKELDAPVIKDRVIQSIDEVVTEKDKEKVDVVARVLQKQGVPSSPGTGPIQNILGYAGISHKLRGTGRKSRKQKKTRRSKRRMLHRP